MHGLYCGAAGIIWALDQLAAFRADGARSYDDRVETLEADLVREPDEPDHPDDRGYLGGRLGRSPSPSATATTPRAPS